MTLSFLNKFFLFNYCFLDVCSICRQVIYIEVAVYAIGELISPPKPDLSAQLRTVDLVVIDHDVQALIVDLEILIGLVKVNCVISLVSYCD